MGPAKQATEQLSIGARIGAFAAFIAAATAIATAFTLLASRLWIADLLVHFRLQYAAVALLAGVVLLRMRRPVWAVAALALAAVNLLLAAPAMGWAFVSDRGVAVAAPAGRQPGVPVRLAAVNVYFRNDEYARTVEFIRREKPDAVVFVEVSAPWREALRVLHDEYPHAHFTGKPGSRGVLLLSRWPIERAVSPPLEEDVEPPVLATLRVRERAVHVLGVHVSWPMGPAASAKRNRQLAELAQLTRTLPAPLVMLGDLNVSPFSPHFQALLAQGGLRSAAESFGWQPTWPTFLPLAGIQIDHALVSAGVEVRDFRRGSAIGSDHLPVLLELAL